MLVGLAVLCFFAGCFSFATSSPFSLLPCSTAQSIRHANEHLYGKIEESVQVTVLCTDVSSTIIHPAFPAELHHAHAS